MMEDTLASLKAQMGNIFVGEEPPPDPEDTSLLGRAKLFWREVTNAFQLTYTQRIVAFVSCLALGLLFISISTMFVVMPTKFAKYYTFGSLFITISSFFLVGPTRQLRSIIGDNSKSIAAVIYVLSMALTLWSALSLGSVFLATFFVIVQFLSSVWYGASFIPFAQSCLRSTAKAILPL